MAKHHMDFREQYWEYITYHQMGASRDWRRWFRWAVMFDRYERHQWFLDILNSIREEPVTRTKVPPKSKNGSSANTWTTFVDIKIAEEAYNDIQTLYDSTDTLTAAFEDMLASGYRISFSYNSQTDAVICAMTCRNDESENNKKTVTSFGSTWVEALQVSLYKHHVISGGTWGDSDGKIARPRIG